MSQCSNHVSLFVNKQKPSNEVIELSQEMDSSSIPEYLSDEIRNTGITIKRLQKTFSKQDLLKKWIKPSKIKVTTKFLK